MKVIFAESHNLDRPDPVGSHQYIRLFKEAGHNCLWLGPAVSPMHIFKPDQLNRHRFRVWCAGGRNIEGIEWLVPFTLLFYYNQPFLRSLYIGRNQYRFCLPPLPGKLEKAGFGHTDLLWCAGPVAYSLLDLVSHRISCYRLADRLDQFSAIPNNVNELQADLVKKVDFVLATSRELEEWALTIRRDHVYYLPNGVSDQFFADSDFEPDDFPSTGLPVAVYLGTIDTRFDLETLTKAVGAMPDIYFLLVGPVTDNRLLPGLQKLQEQLNFKMVGPKPYSELPAYLKRCKVGLIPFHLNDLTAAVNPIKYYEYLACGLPVVAPPMRELTGMNGPLNMYRTAKEFCQAIRNGVNTAKEDREKLVRYAENQTWRARYKEVEKIIDKLMSEDNV